MRKIGFLFCIFVSIVCFGVLAEANYYEVLGVSPNSSQEEIKRAYRTLAQQFHPDKSTLPADQANAEMAKINEANGVLKDPKTRRLYDGRLENRIHTGHNFTGGGANDSKDTRFDYNKYYENFNGSVEIYTLDLLKRRMLATLAVTRGGKKGSQILLMLARDPSLAIRSYVLAFIMDRVILREWNDINVQETLETLAYDSSQMSHQLHRDILKAITNLNTVSDFRGVNVQEILKILAVSAPLITREDVLKTVVDMGGFFDRTNIQMNILSILALDQDFDLRKEVLRETINLLASMRNMETINLSDVSMGNTIIQIFTKDSSVEIRTLVPFYLFDKLTIMSENDRFSILSGMALDSHPKVRISVIHNVSRLTIGDSIVEKILNLFVKDTDWKVILELLKVAVYSDTKTARSITSQVLKDHPDVEIRNQAIEYIRANQNISDDRRKLLLRSCESKFKRFKNLFKN